MNSSTKELFPSELEFASQESNAKDLISVKKRLLCRKHETLQIQFEQRFEQILEIVLFAFDSSDANSSSEGNNSLVDEFIN